MAGGRTIGRTGGPTRAHRRVPVRISGTSPAPPPGVKPQTPLEALFSLLGGELLPQAAAAKDHLAPVLAQLAKVYADAGAGSQPTGDFIRNYTNVNVFVTWSNNELNPPSAGAEIMAPRDTRPGRPRKPAVARKFRRRAARR